MQYRRCPLITRCSETAHAAAGDEGTPSAHMFAPTLSIKLKFASANFHLNFVRRTKHHLREAQSSLWRKPNHHFSPQEKYITFTK